MTEFEQHLESTVFHEAHAAKQHSLEERVVVPVKNSFVAEMQPFERERMLDTFQENGLVVLEMGIPDRPEVVRENLLALSQYFGELEAHKHAKGGIVDITTTSGIYATDAVKRPQNDNGRQSPHTDGAFGKVPEILVLGCFRPAAQGGESLFVDMQAAFTKLWEQDVSSLATLFLPNAVTVVRGDQRKSGPVFTVEDGYIRSTYSNHEYNVTEIDERSKKGFSLLDGYVKDVKNQQVIPTKRGSIAIIDNMRMLHGRNSFIDKAGSERWLMRAWYDGNGEAIQKIPRGFISPK